MPKIVALRYRTVLYVEYRSRALSTVSSFRICTSERSNPTRATSGPTSEQSKWVSVVFLTEHSINPPSQLTSTRKQPVGIAELHRNEMSLHWARRAREVITHGKYALKFFQIVWKTSSGSAASAYMEESIDPHDNMHLNFYCILYIGRNDHSWLKIDTTLCRSPISTHVCRHALL